MGTLIHDIVGKGFDASKTKAYELSILVGMDSFDYIVLDAQQQLMLWRSYELSSGLKGKDTYAEIVQQDRVLRQAFLNSRVGWYNPQQTLVPQRLYNPSDLSVYLGQSVGLDESDEIRAEKVPNTGLYNVYALDKSGFSAFQGLFPGSRHFHAGTALLHEQQRLMSGLEKPAVFIHLRGKHLWVSVFDHTTLRFFNSFEYKSSKDFVYYALLAFEEAGLKPSDAHARLSGSILEASEIYRQLHRYLPDLNFVPRSAYFQYGEQLQKQPAYFFFDLLSLSHL